MCRPTQKCAAPSKSCSKSPAKTPVKTKRFIKKESRVKKSVRFSFSDNKVTFRHLLKEDLDHAWYQSKEYKVFQHDRMTTIQTLRGARGDLKALNPSEQCVRGLEMNATPEIFKYRAQGIKTTIRSVLQQQLAQRRFGLKDPTSLGMVSMASSKPARHLAAALAVIDSQQRL